MANIKLRSWISDIRSNIIREWKSLSWMVGPLSACVRSTTRKLGSSVPRQMFLASASSSTRWSSGLIIPLSQQSKVWSRTWKLSYLQKLFWTFLMTRPFGSYFVILWKRDHRSVGLSVRGYRRNFWIHLLKNLVVCVDKIEKQNLLFFRMYCKNLKIKSCIGIYSMYTSILILYNKNKITNKKN